jgi:hypothetical protein
MEQLAHLAPSLSQADRLQHHLMRISLGFIGGNT